MDTIAEVVDAGVLAQAGADKHLAKAYDFAIQNVNVTVRGVELGMVRGTKAKLVIALAREAAGSVAAAARQLAELHHLQVEICQDNNADLGNVTTAGGVTIGGVGPLSGGR